MIYSPQFKTWFQKSGLRDKETWARLWNDALMARPGVAEFMDAVVTAARKAAFEEAAKVADKLAEDWREKSEDYCVGGDYFRRMGMSDGAEDVAAAIRALAEKE